MTQKTSDNLSAFKNFKCGYMSIFNPTTPLQIYGTDLTTPTFEVNNATSTATFNGDLDVNGTATFSTVVISEVKDPMMSLASDNPADLKDIGYFGLYVNAGSKYRGVVIDASDIRLKPFSGTATKPTSTVTSIDSYLIGATFSDVRVSDGLVGTPSLAFTSETNTGLYRVGPNELGVAINGVKKLSFDVNGLTLASGLRKYIRTEGSLADYTLVGTDHAVMMSTVNTINVNVPLAASHSGKEFIIIKTGAAGIITLVRSGADTFDGAATSIALNTQYDRTKLVSDGVSIWYTGL